MRLRAYPKMWEALEALPPKVLALSSSEPCKPVELPAEESLETRVDDVTARIQQATFTGKGGDKERVIAMYKDYVARIATALQKTLALAAVENAPKEEVLMPRPAVMVPPAAPLRFAAGQVLLSLPTRRVAAAAVRVALHASLLLTTQGIASSFPCLVAMRRWRLTPSARRCCRGGHLALGGTQPRLSKH